MFLQFHILVLLKVISEDTKLLSPLRVDPLSKLKNGLGYSLYNNDGNISDAEAPKGRYHTFIFVSVCLYCLTCTYISNYTNLLVTVHQLKASLYNLFFFVYVGNGTVIGSCKTVNFIII